VYVLSLTFFFNDPPTTEIYTLSLHDALPILSESIRSPLILENITSHLPLRGDMEEVEFINAICEKAKCGLLLDVTNLLVNAKNHHYDPLEWLEKINPLHIRQLHIVGYSKMGNS